MSLFGGPWGLFVMQTPYFLALLIVGMMCIKNYHRNPRGSIFLGLALGLTLISLGLWILIKSLHIDWARVLGYMQIDWYELLGVDDPQVPTLGFAFLTGLLHAGSWILIGLAVFARSRHESADAFPAES